MSRHLVETTVNLVIAEIKSNISAALAGVRAQVNDPVVTTEIPVSYFIYPRAKGYRTPAVFVIADNMDFRQSETGGNFIDAKIRLNVSILLEDQDREKLTKRSWRYQAALHQVLANTQMTSSDSAVRAVSIVRNSTFSPIYTRAKNEDDPQAIFAIEVLLELEVDHYENF